MPTTRDAFLADILEHPEDDTPRLVFADWLEDNGEADRAEFIRVQIEAARLGRYEPRREALEQRIKALLDRYRKTWLQEVTAWARPGAWFERGFVGKVECPAGQLLKSAAELFRRAPVQAIVLKDASADQVVALAAAPFLARLTDISLTHISIQPVAALLASPHLGRLLGFSLTSYSPLGPDLGRSLALSAALTRLARLSLPRADIGPEGARFLASSPNVEHLATLDLSINSLGNEGTTELFTAPRLGRLKELYLSFNSIGPAGVRALATSPALAELTRLDLSANPLGPEGAQALAQSQHLDRLRWLNLGGGAQLRDAGAAALARSPSLANLSHLGLQSSTIGPEGVRALADSPHLSRLASLDLARNPIKDEGARALLESPHLASLARLNLFQCDLGKEARQALRQRFGEGLTVEPDTEE